MIKNIIFDMGNVIIDIDVPTTYRAFADLAGISEEEATQRFHAKDFYHRFEIGEITNDEFRDLMKNEFGENLTGDQIDVAWSALLLDMPKERLDKIQELGKSYRVFLLSNTNAIHIKEVTERAANLGYNFSGLFEKMFLSYQMGFMKPEPAFYEEVLKNSGLLASETVFIDDNADNIKGAESLGIQTIWLSPIGSLLGKLSEF
jgi:epoxide hydrolase-like predicted phosphatase